MAGLFDPLINAGLQAYDKMNDRKTLPANKRIFLESILDKNKNKITEQHLSKEELAALEGIIKNKYKSLDDPLKQYKDFLTVTLAKDDKFVAAKNKDQMMYPTYRQQVIQDLQAINNYQQGKITPDFLDLAAGKTNHQRYNLMFQADVNNKVFNVKPNVQYPDYGIYSKNENAADQARTVTGANDPVSSLSTLLGRFNYAATPEGTLVVKDQYDFNPPTSTLTNSPLSANTVNEADVGLGAETGGGGLYGLVRKYAGSVLPPGSGRPVEITIPIQYKDPVGYTIK